MSAEAVQIRSLAEEILQEEVLSLQRPITHKGLSLIPITINEEDVSDFMNTVEALEAGVLEITEIGDAVNTIMAHNKGSKTILIEAAEVLVAKGSQDRIVVESVILKPGQQKRIAVKCVHAPHPLAPGAGFASIGSGAPGLKRMLRKQKYESIMTDVDHYIPETAIDQSAVWSDVDQYCKTAGAPDSKYTEALKKKREKVKTATESIKSSLPEGTCGLIVIDSEGSVLAFELYRNSNSFKQRKGFIESLAMLEQKEKKPLEGEAAWSRGLQLLFRMKELGDEEVISKKDSDTIHIGFDDLRGEAIIGKGLKDDMRAVLYCSIGKTDSS